MRSCLMLSMVASGACAAPIASAPDATTDAASVAEPAPVATPLPCPSDPGLCFVVEPADAEIVLNDESRGTVATLGVPAFMSVASGIYQITLHREGFVTWRAEVSVQTGAERIEVKLLPK